MRCKVGKYILNITFLYNLKTLIPIEDILLGPSRNLCLILDKIRNEYIRRSLKVAPVTVRMRSNRLAWYTEGKMS